MTLAQLAETIGAQIVGDASVQVGAAATLDDATADHVSFLSNPQYEKKLATTRAGAVIVARNITCERLNLLKAPDPYLAFAKAVIALHGHRAHPHSGIHPRAFVEPTATVGEGSVLYPGVYVGPRAEIGRDCILYPNAVIYDDTVLGDRVIVHAGASVGHDGFGFATSKGVHHKIPQVGKVIVEDDVEIGANAAIQRAALGTTIIGKGSKVDSLVSIGHGVKVGEYALLVSQVGIAGSTTLGHHVTLGGQVGVAGHLRIGNNVIVAAQGGIVGDVPDESALMGAPAMPLRHARRVYVAFTKLPEILERIRELEEQMSELGADGHSSEGEPKTDGPQK
ncbi:MAG: UDP-3-O-(3-hydroxymyristoyl)glucosamine N-acyltransferase [Tepidisphaeraceae bacterium]|jgi:UDP-3-O-[3-hydroxymyristoyl] glucosamine N-acyltransferase